MNFGFSTVWAHDMFENQTRKGELVANNIFSSSRSAHHDGLFVHRNASSRNDWSHNIYWPDGPRLFCFGLCAWPGKAPCQNCTSFAAFERDQPHPTRALLAAPKLLDDSAPPPGLRPTAGSPLLRAGMPVGLPRDWAGASVPSDAPSIGAFQAAAPQLAR